MRFFPSLATLALTLVSAVSAAAHEFWISPEKYQVDEGAEIRAELRVGQNFEGSGYAYIPARTARFDLVTPRGTFPVESRMGDRPALHQAVREPGLVIVVHETADSVLTYRDWETFEGFVTHKAFASALERHAARGLPRQGFRESYRRYAKSLIAVGDGQGQDRPVGLLTEIVALANPYTDDMAGGLPVQVLYQGQPRADVQVEVFDRPPGAGGETRVTRLRTDDTGRVTVPVTAGHEYLIDSVVLRDTGNDDPQAGPVWRSLWASLTFRVPED